MRLSSAILLLAVCQTLEKTAEGAAAKNWTLLWGDEFDGNALDRTQWNYELGWGCQYLSSGWPMCGFGNDELQYYGFNNIQVHGGSLHIVARLERDGRTMTSGRIYTSYAVMPDEQYKTIRVSARVKLDRGKRSTGVWPAFWMLPKFDAHSLGCGVYGPWPKSGELDVFETHDFAPYQYLTVHCGERYPNNDWLRSLLQEDPLAPFTEWHTYAVEWELHEIRWYYDGVAVGAVPSLNGTIPPAWENATGWYSIDKSAYPHTPFDQPFYLLLNMALGGSYTGNAPREEVAKTLAAPKEMTVDWVRVEGLEWEWSEQERAVLCSTYLVEKHMLVLDAPCRSRAEAAPD